MRVRLLLAVLGAILRPASALFLLPLGLDLLDGHGRGALTFAVGGAASLALGLLCGRLPRPVPRFGAGEAMAVVSLAWLVVSAVRVSVQGPVPRQPPPFQVMNVEPLAGAARRVTVVPNG